MGRWIWLAVIPVAFGGQPMNAKRTAKQTGRVLAEIETVRRRFEPWRTPRRLPGPIPVRRWDQAVRLARHYGVSRISKILRVGCCPLNTCGERRKDPRACCSESPGDVTFVEREPPATSPGLARLVEWEVSAGAKMRCNSRESRRPTSWYSVVASGGDGNPDHPSDADPGGRRPSSRRGGRFPRWDRRLGAALQAAAAG